MQCAGPPERRHARQGRGRATERFGLDEQSGPGIDGRLGRRVLRRLGLNPDFPRRDQRLAYEVFFPGRNSSFDVLLRDAQRHGKRTVQRWTFEDELSWLAETIRLAPDSRLASWRRAWEQASELTGCNLEKTEGLDRQAREYFIERVATSPPYPSLVADALTEALERRACN